MSLLAMGLVGTVVATGLHVLHQTVVTQKLLDEHRAAVKKLRETQQTMSYGALAGSVVGAGAGALASPFLLLFTGGIGALAIPALIGAGATGGGAYGGAIVAGLATGEKDVDMLVGEARRQGVHATLQFAVMPVKAVQGFATGGWLGAVQGAIGGWIGGARAMLQEGVDV